MTSRPHPEHRIPRWAGDVALMILGMIPSAFPSPRPPMAGPGGAAFPELLPTLAPVILSLIAALQIPLRRSVPVSVFLAALCIYLSTLLADIQPLGPGIAAIIAAYSVANQTRRPVSFTLCGVGAVLVAVISLFTTEQMALDPQVFQIAAGIAIAGALGDSARSRREFTRAATERAERAEQTREAEARRRVAEERLRIAQDLHDTVAHQISVISLNAGVASSSLDTRPDKARESLGTIRAASREVLGDIGVLLNYLREDAATRHPQPGLRDLDALVDSMTATGMKVTLRADGDPDRVGTTVGQVTYRVVQEGLTNAHKHGSGRAANASVSVLDDSVLVTVTNPTSRADPNQPNAPSGQLGLTGLRERVTAAGGTVTLRKDNDIFTLVTELPLSDT
ncbi:MAG: histidine kinase [Corynebacterium sp.]|nr:histidine kinase [Corynebacterium sp.]